jgi:hypothetical protein
MQNSLVSISKLYFHGLRNNKKKRHFRDALLPECYENVSYNLTVKPMVK